MKKNALIPSPKPAENSPFDSAAALDIVLRLMAIPGVSGQERQVLEFVVQQLKTAGADPAMIEIEPPPPNTPVQGEIGSLIFKLPGTIKAPRRLLMAHLDTVPICVGCKPIVDGDYIRSANPATGVGADDRAGAAVILQTAMTILKHKLPHPPLTFYWVVQEEIGLYGARHAKLSRLGKPKLAFNWDGGPAEKLTCGATGGYRLTIDVKGLASHAGGAPEQGVSAIAIASLAIADLVENGWHGDIQKGKQRGTSNVGVIQGGDATNVVTDHVHIKAEARSHNSKFRARIVREIERAFTKAAKKIRSVTGVRGSVQIDGRLDYESFRLSENEPCVLVAEEAVRRGGGKPYRAISNGGLDANWMTANGLPTVTLGCGQMNPHTVSERLDINAFYRACLVAMQLAKSDE